MPDAGAAILYISYDGMLEPLGESQVISYVLALACTHRIVLVSFEKKSDLANPQRKTAMRRRLHDAGVLWVDLRYHKRPPILSTVLDFLIGTIVALGLAVRQRLSIAHARGHVAAAIAFIVKSVVGARFLFDLRGFWPEEKVEAGHWRKNSIVFRITKRLERRFFESADAIVTLTQAGVEILRSSGYRWDTEPRIVCIPTCADLRRFRPGPRDAVLAASLGLSEASVVVGCVGTMSNWYMRWEMLHYLALLASRFAHLHILCITRENHVELQRDARLAGLRDERLHIVQADFDAMPDYIRLMHFGLFFIKPSFSKKGSAPTKLAEFLACGVPVVINDGVGDSGKLVKQNRVGVVIDRVDQTNLEVSLEDVKSMLRDETIAERCRKTAGEVFDLAGGVARYRDLYSTLGNSRSRAAEAAML